jgi:uncharacterized protein (TIGR00369 family)
MQKSQLPYSEGCFVCGTNNSTGLRIRFHNDQGRVVTEVLSTEVHQGYKGVVHGGILCTLLDEAMGWAPTLLTKRMTVSAELNIRFVNPAPIGKKLIVTAQAEEINRRLYTSTGQISGEDGTVYVTATGKFVPLSKEKTKEVDSWLLYDDETLKVFNE